MAANEIILIPQIIASVVSDSWDKIDAQMRTNNGGVQLYYTFLHGTPNEINNRLQRLANAPTLKDRRFPLFALIHNYTEKFDSTAFYNETELTLWIMYPSGIKTDYEDRYTDVFEPFLYPMWQSLIETMRKSGLFYTDMSKGIEHDKTDRPDWGRYVAGLGNTEHKFGERIDGIELKLKLKLNYANCLRAQKERRFITN